MSQCSNKYARANNKYMQLYDTSKQLSHLMNYDVNNLYGWAMCQPLLYADFRWVHDTSNFNIMDIALESPGYILVVDMKYLQQSSRCAYQPTILSWRDKPPGKWQDELLATLYDKKCYVIHYRNLQ